MQLQWPIKPPMAGIQTKQTYAQLTLPGNNGPVSL